MDLFHFNGLKAEKSVVMFWFKCFRTLLELILALALLFWTFNRLPVAVRLSGEFFRRIAGVIVSPLFVFLLGNAIIVTLLIKSGRFSGENCGASNAEAELCEEFVNDGENRSSRLLSENQLALVTKEEIVYQDKEIVSQVNVITQTTTTQTHGGESADSDSDADTPKTYRRTKSEKFMKENAKGKLRRSETEMCRKTKISSDDESFFPEDELSNEEFQKAVDEFIEKNLKFRRQETLSVVPQNQNQTMFSSFNEIEIK